MCYYGGKMSCQFIEICKENDEIMTEFCNKNFLRCARFIVGENSGIENVPKDLKPNEKDRAYDLLVKQ